MIKTCMAILSGTVVAGLLTYAFLELTGSLGLLGTSGRMTIPIWLFVAQIAIVGLLSSFFTILFVRLLKAEEKRGIEGIEKRVRELES